MKKLLLLIVMVIVLSGCAVLEIADMIFDDDCLWRGTVAAVEHSGGETAVIFEGGNEYTCEPASWVDVGSWIEARRTESGCVFSR